MLGPVGKTVAVRVPEHAALRRVLAAAGGPVVATSANISGQPPLLTAEEVRATFPAGVDHVMVSGAAPAAAESSIVRVGEDESLAVLRDGAIDRARLAPVIEAVIALVCTGNTCRSPMAEVLLAAAVAARLGIDPAALPGAGMRVISAGVAAAAGHPASVESQAATARRGVSLRSHRSQPLSRALGRRADALFVMTESQIGAVRRSLSGDHVAVELFDPTGADIPDPFGGHPEDYEACARQIAVAAAVRATDLAARFAVTSPSS